MTNATLNYITSNAIHLSGDKASGKHTITKVACPKPMVIGCNSYESAGCNCIVPCKTCACKL